MLIMVKLFPGNSSAYQSPFQVTSLNLPMGPLGSNGGFYTVIQNNTKI